MNKELLSKFIINDQNDTESIFDFSDTVVEGIVTWIQKAFTPIKTVNKRHSSYSLKHILQDNIGLYMTENQFKMAMILAGFEPSNYNDLSHTYRISQHSIAFSLRHNPVMQLSPEDFEKVLNSGIEVTVVMNIRWDIKWKDTNEYFNIDDCINLYGYTLQNADYGYGTVSVDNGDLLLFDSVRYNRNEDRTRVREELFKIVNLTTHEIIDVSWVASLHVCHKDFESAWGKFSYGIVKCKEEDRIKFDISRFRNVYDSDYIIAINDGRRRQCIRVEYFDKI